MDTGEHVRADCHQLWRLLLELLQNLFYCPAQFGMNSELNQSINQ